MTCILSSRSLQGRVVLRKENPRGIFSKLATTSSGSIDVQGSKMNVSFPIIESARSHPSLLVHPSDRIHLSSETCWCTSNKAKKIFIQFPSCSFPDASVCSERDKNEHRPAWLRFNHSELANIFSCASCSRRSTLASG